MIVRVSSFFMVLAMRCNKPADVRKFWLFVEDVRYTLFSQLGIRASMNTVSQWLNRDENLHYWTRYKSEYLAIEKRIKSFLSGSFCSVDRRPTVLSSILLR